jgi:hypothetical protein
MRQKNPNDHIGNQTRDLNDTSTFVFITAGNDAYQRSHSGAFAAFCSSISQTARFPQDVHYK